MGRTSDARERLLRSAGQLIAQNGYQAVGVSEICQDANVNKGSFYHFFSSKQDLGLEVINEHWELAEHHVWQSFAGDKPLAEKLRLLFRSGKKVQEQDKEECGSVPGCMLGNLALELSTQDEEVRKRLQEIFSQQASILETAVAQAMDSGEIERGNAKEIADQILAYLQGVTLMAKVKNDPRVLTKAARGAAHLAGL